MYNDFKTNFNLKFSFKNVMLQTGKRKEANKNQTVMETQSPYLETCLTS